MTIYREIRLFQRALSFLVSPKIGVSRIDTLSAHLRLYDFLFGNFWLDQENI
jgi:hypothetical protein